MRGRILVAAALLLLTAAARAEEQGARVDFEEGTKRYALAEYGEALEAFKHAYMKYPAPGFLFNIAQCHRQLGHRKEAARFYRTYLELSPTATDRAEVEASVAALEREEAAAAPADERPAVTSGRPASVVAAPSSPAARPVTRRPLLWGVLAGAAALVAGGIVVGVVVGTAERDPMPTRGTVQWLP